jgi:hypothetical protein
MYDVIRKATEKWRLNLTYMSECIMVKLSIRIRHKKYSNGICLLNYLLNYSMEQSHS